MAGAIVGVIGGSGLYQIEGMRDVDEVPVTTPFGDPSDAITIGTLGSQRVAFLPRHGRGHRISPTELNVRANIYALKSLGVEWVISVSAVGSMKEEIAPLDVVIPDQLFDRTKSRINTFFGDGLVVHVSFAEPFCPVLSDVLYHSAQSAGARVHQGGTYVCIEGPQFSTKAESRIYRQWGVDVIGMTAIPEAKLAREAELCYATLAMSTDYDVWHESGETVTVEMVIANLLKNVDTAKHTIVEAVSRLPSHRSGCTCAEALKSAIITAPDRIPDAIKRDYGLLIGKYVS
ncbi:MAG: S-methyl-5'-thioadenosine phosphorylase [Chloroflexi bacterium]|nr:S-methyl-5'-thioadenosine phosphorylase [Chloroflexota bacterium]